MANYTLMLLRRHINTSGTVGRCLIIGVLTLFPPVPLCLHASGCKVVLFLENKSVVIGELLCVRDTELVLATRIGYSDEELSSNESLRFSVSTRDIQEVKVEGRSHLMTGAAIGAGAGLTVGVAIALAQPREDERGWGSIGAPLEHGQKVLGIIAGSVACGLFIGGALGEVTSSGDKFIVSEYSTALKRFARFPNEEPDFLQNPGQER